MPFVRITRDKRGYQYFSLVQPESNPHGRGQQRVLYWLRSPPETRVGREPFDAETRRTLESQYPDIVFDWERLSRTPIPPVPIDWRERRRAEKIARRQERVEDGGDQPSDGVSDAAGDQAMPGPHEHHRRRRRHGRRESPQHASDGGPVQESGSGSAGSGPDEIQ